MSTYYISTHGMIWGEISASGVTTSYGHDALGSVIETYSAGALENTYRYKPFGATLARTGVDANPSFLWNGGSGYRATGLPCSDSYIRARHFSSISSQWINADLFWPDELAYAYASNNPISRLDPSGLGAWPPLCCSQLGKPSWPSLARYINTPVNGRGQTVFSFKVPFTMRKIPINDSFLGIGVTWREMTNVPYDLVPTANTWTDLTSNAIKQCFYDFAAVELSYRSGCSSSTGSPGVYYSHIDAAKYPKGNIKVRCLCIAVTFIDGCGHTSHTFTLNQTVDFNTDPPVVNFPNDPETVKYCNGQEACSQLPRTQL